MREGSARDFLKKRLSSLINSKGQIFLGRDKIFRYLKGKPERCIPVPFLYLKSSCQDSFQGWLLVTIPQITTQHGPPSISAMPEVPQKRSRSEESESKSREHAEKVFAVLNDYLDPESPLPLDLAVESLLKLLPTDAPDSEEICRFGEDCFELAEMTSYKTSAHSRLAQLLEALGLSSHFTFLTKEVLFLIRGKSDHHLQGT